MVGWLPGGSAGTSFCSGTEMSISLRAMHSLHFPDGGIHRDARVLASNVLTLDLVFQNADILDLEFDQVTVFEILAELEPAAIAHRARADELAGHQGLV